MIISHEHKLLFLSSPKCGTHSGYQLLLSYGGETIEAQHGVIVPDEYKDYFIFTFVRNPYDRVASMYNWITNYDGDGDFFRIYNANLYLQERDANFDTFCKWLGTLTNEDYFYDFNICQYDHLKQSNVFEQIEWVKLEDPLVKCLPKEREVEHKYPFLIESADDECIELINNWAKKDFEYFNYGVLT
jgi:hypothetical protein